MFLSLRAIDARLFTTTSRFIFYFTAERLFRFLVFNLLSYFLLFTSYFLLSFVPGLKLARCPRSLAATLRSFTFHVAHHHSLRS